MGRSLLIAWIWVLIVAHCNGQFPFSRPTTVRWCAVGEFEQKKCLDWSQAMGRSGQFSINLTCIQTRSKDECVQRLDDEDADLASLDPGEVFTAGRYHSLVPIMTERYGTGSEPRYFSVAVVKSNSNIRQPSDLHGRRACFPGVGQMAGWVLPVVHLLRQNIMEVTDCNNLLKSVAAFFGPSCAINALLDKHNPTGDNPSVICSQCAGNARVRCSDLDPNAGFSGAFNCLARGQGEVAFLKHTTVQEMVADRFSGYEKNNFELLCQYGGRKPIDSYSTCHWGGVPAHAIMTSSAKTPEIRRQYQEFLRRSVQLFGGPPSGPAPHPNMPASQLADLPFSMFQSFGYYGKNYNLLFQDTARRLEPLDETKQTFMDYLGDYQTPILELRKCQLARLKLCIVSEMEVEKCYKMKTAFKAQMLKPDLTCFKGHSHRECMAAISQGLADAVMLDAGDVYTAGKDYNLIPVMAEHYNLDGPYYYAVAVASIEDRDSDLLILRGKQTCHTGMSMAAGWVVPISFLLKNNRLRDYGCDGPKAAAEFFQKSCIPGALSPDFNANYKQNSMCDLCHGTSSSFCQRDHNEDFFGYTGAFRCLVEGGGQIAFVKHTTVFENTDGNNPMWWSRNVLAVDFELLCRDGSRAPVHDYADCNLGRVPGNALVMRPYNNTEIEATINLLLYAQQFYASKFEEDFKFQMFQSPFPHHDLIFQDAAQQLQPIDSSKRHYHQYLGNDFLRAKQAIDCTACATTAEALVLSLCLPLLLFTVLVR